MASTKTKPQHHVGQVIDQPATRFTDAYQGEVVEICGLGDRYYLILRATDDQPGCHRYLLVDDDGDLYCDCPTEAAAEQEAWENMVRYETEGNGRMGELLTQVPCTEQGAIICEQVIGLLTRQLAKLEQ